MKKATGFAHLIYGPVGAGKTTYAKRKAEELNAVVFTMDEWMTSLFQDDYGPQTNRKWLLERSRRCEKQIWKLSRQILNSGIDVILDLGLWERADRDWHAEYCDKHGIEYEFYYVNASVSLRRDRVFDRNLLKPETYEFEVTDVMFASIEELFESPDADELTRSINVNTENF